MSLHVILALVGYYLFSAAAGAMEPPLPGAERTFYAWLYRFAQILAANTDRLVKARLATLAAAEDRDFEERLATSSSALSALGRVRDRLFRNLAADRRDPAQPRPAPEETDPTPRTSTRS